MAAARPVAYLVTGSEELLVRRAADRLLEELREESGGELELTDVRADELAEGELPDLRTASLFGGRRVVRIRDAQALPAEHARALAELVAAPPPDATLVLTASGTGRIRSLAAAIKEIDGRVDVDPPKPWDEKGWQRLVAAELRRHERSGDDAAVRALLEHAGRDVGVIAEKVSQVVRESQTPRVTVDDVERAVAGPGDHGAFAIADAVCQRDPATALRLLRGALDAGQEPLMILGALAYRLRSMVAVAAGLTEGSATEQRDRIGMSVSGGQAGHLRDDRRRFGPGELTAAYRTLAAADVAIKSSDLPPEAVLEQAVVDIATPSQDAAESLRSARAAR